MQVMRLFNHHVFLETHVFFLKSSSLKFAVLFKSNFYLDRFLVSFFSLT